MLRSRLLWRLYAGYVFLSVLTAVVVAMTVGPQLAERSRFETERSLRWLLRLLADDASAALQGDQAATSELRDQLERRGPELGIRFTVIAADGQVLLDSNADPASMDNHMNRPEVRQAAEHGVGVVERSSRTLGVDFVYFALPVEEVGYVRAAVPVARIKAELTSLWRNLILAIGLSVFAGLVLGFFVVRQITARILHITEVVESMAKGDYRQRLWIGSRDEIGKLARAFNTLASELRQRVEAIDNENNKLLAILGGMIEGVIAVDAEERVVHMNAAAAEILEVTGTDCIGKPLWEVTRQREVAESVSECLTRRSVVRTETNALVERGERFLEFHAAPLATGSGESIGAVLVFHDVTELRRLESVRRDFVANVSHELKTPITAIRGLVETMLEDPEMPIETRERFLERARVQTSRLSELVSDLLSIARLESETQLVEAHALDLRDPLSRASQGLSATAEHRGVRLEVDLPADEVRCHGDGEALQQAVSNLIDNAIKYSKSGDAVSLRLERRGDQAIVEVEDRGVGIEPSHLERIFERFYRVDKARSRELGGTGLGLAIVKHVCRAHHGEVEVESVPGQGSVFRISIPLPKE